MEREAFQEALRANEATIERIRDMAHKVHAAVNQHYDQVLPYAVHLDAVAEHVRRYAHHIVVDTADVMPLMFGAYFHDSIEDARLTYNNVKHVALKFMSEPQAHMAAEIVYALTNEKGRSRAERANDRYYHGIRTTPYAPLCKVADRLANVSYSVGHSADTDVEAPRARSQSMRHVYKQENPHFVASVCAGTPPADQRLWVPRVMLEDLAALLN